MVSPKNSNIPLSSCTAVHDLLVNKFDTFDRLTDKQSYFIDAPCRSLKMGFHINSLIVLNESTNCINECAYSLRNTLDCNECSHSHGSTPGLRPLLALL